MWCDSLQQRRMNVYVECNHSPFECALSLHLLSSISIFHARSAGSIGSGVAAQRMSTEPSSVVVVMS